MPAYTLGQKIRALRLKRGWTIEDMAARLKVSHQAVSRWELGTVDLPRSRIEEIAKVFGITPSMLFAGTRSTKDTQETADARKERSHA